MSRNCVRARGKRKGDTLQAVAQEMGQTFEKLELIKLKKNQVKRQSTEFETFLLATHLIEDYYPDDSRNVKARTTRRKQTI